MMKDNTDLVIGDDDLVLHACTLVTSKHVQDTISTIINCQV